MIPLVNEWQLQSQLNQALQTHHRADFSLWLAMLSPAVEEMAQFFPTPLADEPKKPTLYQQLGVNPQRDYAMQEDDVALFDAQHQALVADGYAQWRLMSLLNPNAVVVRHDPKKLSADVSESLSFHTKRRLSATPLSMPTADPTLMYDMLQHMSAMN
ncbi:hypothetical protein A5320_07475 [Rheinheimera sp. SA_1]|jgi:hypothetical protein|uniref:VC2046/SO_2500 family protein n=1 Tax=Rheinheimera sp. SA_1 TaxID=1827365 RepID=UPI0008008F63|nr:VC2046/SO_2500 family protein [Rheinheimera sp. SA_1]OBP15213.1 hypothetical protein A5320_07475 [Rheinheimera sp. SA_1]